MAGSFHNRSNSLPTPSHPLVQRFEEELCNLKTWASTSSCDVGAGLKGLVELHTCLYNLVEMPQAQAALQQNKHGRWVAEELDGSVVLLDICSSTRDALCSMKEHAQELRSALRTRNVGDSALRGRVGAYMSSRKSAKKEMHAFLKMLKQMEERCDLYPSFEGSRDDSSAIVSAMKEARATTITVYRSILCFFSKSAQRSNGWSLLSKALTKRSRSRVACEADDECSSEIECLDAQLHALTKKELCKHADVHDLEKQLLGLEATIDGAEMKMESLFRRLIRNRVSILNILSL